MDKIINTTRVIPAVPIPEGAGVTVLRTIGMPFIRNYDPFLLLDHRHCAITTRFYYWIISAAISQKIT